MPKSRLSSIDKRKRYSTLTWLQPRRFPGEIVFNAEDDEHMPLLTVQDTYEVALRTKEPKKKNSGGHGKQYVADMTDRLLKAFGMPHTRKTKGGS